MAETKGGAVDWSEKAPGVGVKRSEVVLDGGAEIKPNGGNGDGQTDGENGGCS